jgi:malate dehydrogenase
VGGGNVGATCAHIAAQKELGDIVLVDIVEGMPQGKALDMFESSPVDGFDCRVVGSNGYGETANSDVVIITSGLARKPGMSRDDLLAKNMQIVDSVTRSVAEKSPDAILIVVSNPLDAMVYTAYKASEFPANRVVGQAGILDSARMRSFIAEALDCSVRDVVTVLLGGHGDDMVPLPRYTYVGGVPLDQLMDQKSIDAIVDRTRNGGAEIVGLLKTGSAFYAPAASTVEMAESIIRDKRRILPCAAYCDENYGVGGYFVGVPCMLGKNGVEKIIEIDLNNEERAMFNASVDHVKELCAKVDSAMSN